MFMDVLSHFLFNFKHSEGRDSFYFQKSPASLLERFVRLEYSVTANGLRPPFYVAITDLMVLNESHIGSS